MDVMITPLFGFVVLLSIVIPGLFVLGIRYVAYRVAGRPESLHLPATDILPVPQFASRWQAIRTLALITLLGMGTGITAGAATLHPDLQARLVEEVLRR